MEIYHTVIMLNKNCNFDKSKVPTNTNSPHSDQSHYVLMLEW